MDNSGSVVVAVGAGLFWGLRHRQPDSPVAVSSTRRTGDQSFIWPTQIKPAASELSEVQPCSWAEQVCENISLLSRANRWLKLSPADMCLRSSKAKEIIDG